MTILSWISKPRHLLIKEENGLILSIKSEVIKIWKQYCEKFTISDNMDSINQKKIWDESKPLLLQSKIEIAIKRLCNHKAVGSNDIVAKMIKENTEKEVDTLYNICFKIWTIGKRNGASPYVSYHINP